jgi:hypothetical protein
MRSVSEPIRAPQYDPNEDDARNKDVLREERKARKIFNTYKRVFDNADGRYVLRDMMRLSHFYDPLFASHEAYDPLEAARREGGRELFLYVLRQAQANEAEYRRIREVTLE